MARILVLDTLKHPSNSGTANIVLSSDETTTMPTVNINGGQIDATTVGASTPSSVAATTISASGNATVGGTFGVTGASTLTGNTTVGGTLGITGLATVGGTLGITGASTVGGTFGVTGATTLSSTLGVTGATTLSSTAAITGNTTVGGTLAVTGTITGSSTLTATTINGAYISGQQLDYQNDPTNVFLGRVPASVASSGLGTHNIGISGKTGVALNQGQQNTWVGWGAMDDNVSSNFNTAFGVLALASCTGAANTAMGVRAGQSVSSGGNNLLLGTYAGDSDSPSGDITTGSNIVVLGNNSISSLYCNDTSISSSDGRDKTDVEDFTPGLEWIEAMRPVTYHWDKRSWYEVRDEETGKVTSQSTPDGTHKKDKKNIGFIAQEVLEIEKIHGFSNDKNDMLIVNLNEDDTAYGMKYERLVPVLVNAIKELSQSNKELSTKVKALETA